MKRILIAFLLCATALAADLKIATVNYETVFSKWSVAVAFSEQTKASLDAVNAKLSVKVGTRDAILKQAQDIAATKPNNEAEAKQLQARLDVAKADLDAANKEVQALQESPELRKQISDKQVELRKQVQAEVAKQAAAVKADITLDSSALNAFGAPVVTTGPLDITDAVVSALNPPAPAADAKAPAKK